MMYKIGAYNSFGAGIYLFSYPSIQQCTGQGAIVYRAIHEKTRVQTKSPRALSRLFYPSLSSGYHSKTVLPKPKSQLCQSCHLPH